MRKFWLRKEGEMSSSSAYVEDAAEFAKSLSWDEARFPGDYKPAMERAARDAQVSPGLLWRMRYRKPKSIDAADFVKLGEAYGKKRLSEKDGYVPRTTLGRYLVDWAAALERKADAMDRAKDGAVD